MAPKGVVCVFECLSANLALQGFFQAIKFCFTRTTKHQHTRNLSLFFYYLHGKFVDCIIRLLFCIKFFAYYRFPNIFVHAWYPRTAESTMARPWPRILATFKAWLLSTCSLDLINVKDNHNFYVDVSKPWLFVLYGLSYGRTVISPNFFGLMGYYYHFVQLWGYELRYYRPCHNALVIVLLVKKIPKMKFLLSCTCSR